jgi:hypothetical protein
MGRGVCQILPRYRANIAYPGSLITFTNTSHIVTNSDQVRKDTTPAPGPKDAVRFFEFGINSIEDTIC